MSVRTGRVQLTLPTPADEADLIGLVRRSRSLHEPWVFPPDSPERYRAYLDRIAAGRTIGYFVKERESGRLAGVVNLNEPLMGALCSAYLGYYADIEMAGRGLLSEGVSLAIDAAFSAGGFHRLEANIQPGNAASLALVRRLGFGKEGFSPRYLNIGGEWRDHERWAILSDEWTIS
jgi:ribosomal-protein-alanine N-acetyltransferase